jgi:primosomal protein N' (replication factor Y)
LERRGVAGVAMLLADDGPERRYRQWLRVLRGQARIAVGTRSAVFAPMHNLVAMCVWNEWEDSLCDPQAPYWNARDVAVLRSAQSNCALVLAGAAMSCEAVALRPWAAHICRSTAEVRERMPMVRAATGNRIPSAVLQALRKGLSGGPVLVTVVRAGYQPRLACDGCRELASCSYCQGPLIRTSRSSDPSCAHCGQIATSWSCPWCSVTRLRAPSPGSERTAEELGRAFPGVPVRSSSGDSIVRTIDSRPSIVVATAGAIPVAAGGYTAAAILDGDMMLARPDLRATEDAFARWSEVVASVRSAGEVVVVAASEHPAVQALIRHDPMGLAERELHARETVQLPPACRVVALTGSPEDVSALAVDVSGAHVRGPVPVGDGKVRLLLSTSKADGARLVAQVRAATVARAAGRKGGVVNVRVDPRDL